MKGFSTVYDIGMNNGDDSQYYLEKGYRVVGIDADPNACAICSERFKAEIATGRMIVINNGVGLIEGRFPFYINNIETPISSFVRPERLAAHWSEMWIDVVKASSLIRQFGLPHFVKIDVEHYDNFVLIDLQDAGILPEYISAEAHTIDVLDSLIEMGYRSFKLMPGVSVHELYHDHNISTVDGKNKRYSFPALCSGPFGDDIPGPWYDVDAIRKRLVDIGLGWIDVHARRL